jgi:16S rRNA (cytidine1402-2'-O)-methyltransferase
VSGSAPTGTGGILYVVATPLGNADDITARALRVLAEVDLIACEDTRRTARLLAAHSIHTPTVSYFEHNEERRSPELVERLQMGAKVALVTDAGTPAISDPGYRLVRAASDAGIRVTAVPGPSAVTAALSIAGLPTDRFVFEGFLPMKAGERQRALERLALEERTIVFFEAARRLNDLLAVMAAVFGGDRMVAILRELTKTYEEVARGRLDEIAARFAQGQALGEVTIVIEGARRTQQDMLRVPVALDEAGTIEILREAGLTLKQASALIAKLTGLSRRDVYQRAVTAKKPED